MKRFLTCAVCIALLGLCAAPLSAQTLFSYEVGETGQPYIGNPALYTVSTSLTTGVTHGAQALQVSTPVPTFGGPQSAVFTDANLANLINGANEVLIDMTVPNVAFGFGNIDLQFFQDEIRPGFDFDETRFSATFAASSGQTITLAIPLTLTQFGSPRITLDPTESWAYQIDLSFNSAAPGPFVFQFDNLRVVPEPASLAGAALVGLSLVTRRRRRA
jgi:hypothetical protein